MSQAHQEPVVSIVVPFLNAERFMAEAIKSVLGQTFTDWELLVVDDGSSDSSTAFGTEPERLGAQAYIAEADGNVGHLSANQGRH